MGELEAGSQLTKQRGHSLLIRTIATNIATPKKKAYSIPASSIDEITGADSIARDIHPAAETA